MIDLDDDGGGGGGGSDSRREGVVVTCAFMGIIVLSCHAGIVFPKEAQVDNPLDARWQTLEMVSMVSLYTQIKAREADSMVNIQDCRPGVDFFSNGCRVCIRIPTECKFALLGSLLDAQPIHLQ